MNELKELQAPQGATTTETFVTPEWAHRWPTEEVWKVHKDTTPRTF